MITYSVIIYHARKQRVSLREFSHAKHTKSIAPCSKSQCAIVCREYQLLATRFAPQVSGCKVKSVERAKRRTHWLRGTMENGARQLNQIQSLEYPVNRLTAYSGLFY